MWASGHRRKAGWSGLDVNGDEVDPFQKGSRPGQAVNEPFMGSGTTLIAAETTGRVCHSIELNPAYVRCVPPVRIEPHRFFPKAGGLSPTLRHVGSPVRRSSGPLPWRSGCARSARAGGGFRAFGDYMIGAYLKGGARALNLLQS
jgi:hypothetical protein